MRNNKELIIEQTISKNRLKPILSEIEKRGGIRNLHPRKRQVYAYIILKEIHYLNQNDLLTENWLTSILGKGVSGAIPSLIETLLEPLLNGFFVGLGLPQGVSNFLTSALTRNPADLLQAFFKGDCRKITEIVLESSIEALVMTGQQKLGLGGSIMDFIRNDLLAAIKSSNLIEKLSDNLEDKVCSMVQDIKGKAGSVTGLLGLGS